jgi:hypothetical protein
MFFLLSCHGSSKVWLAKLFLYSKIPRVLSLKLLVLINWIFSMNNSQKEKTEKEIGRMVSDCCEFSTIDLYTYPRVVEKHYRLNAVDLPPYQDVTICTCCHNMCHKVAKMVG